MFPEIPREVRELEEVGGSQGIGTLSPQTSPDLSACGVPKPGPCPRGRLALWVTLKFDRRKPILWDSVGQDMAWGIVQRRSRLAWDVSPPLKFRAWQSGLQVSLLPSWTSADSLLLSLRWGYPLANCGEGGGELLFQPFLGHLCTQQGR